MHLPNLSPLSCPVMAYMIKKQIALPFLHTRTILECDPSQTTRSWLEEFCFGMLDLAKREGWGST